MAVKQVKATVLFYPASVKGRWVAHCLDFDLVGTGDNPGEAFTELLGALEVQMDLWNELGADAAPPRHAPRELWDAAKDAIPLPAPDIGGLKGWAEKHDKARKTKLRREIKARMPKVCKIVLLPTRPKLALAMA